MRAQNSMHGSWRMSSRGDQAPREPAFCWHQSRVRKETYLTLGYFLPNRKQLISVKGLALVVNQNRFLAETETASFEKPNIWPKPKFGRNSRNTEFFCQNNVGLPDFFRQKHYISAKIPKQLLITETVSAK